MDKVRMMIVEDERIVAMDLQGRLKSMGYEVVGAAVSGEEAIVFLGGANAGAAVYEYGLSWSTCILLRRAARPGYSSFEDEWVPKAYLANYYGAVDADERHTIAFSQKRPNECRPMNRRLFSVPG